MLEKNLEIQERFWEKHFQYYDFFQQQFSWYRETVKFHLEQMRAYKKILDTGAGSGNLTKELLEKGHEVVAIDSEPYALKQLNDKVGDAKELQIVIGDVHDMSFKDNFFDGVNSMFLLPFIYNEEAYLKEVCKVLKKGGKFSISAWSPEPDIFRKIKEKIEEELIQKEILPKHKIQWEEFLKTSAINATNVKKSKLNKDRLIKLLKILNFNNIEIFDGIAYENFAYFLTCNK